MEEQKTEVEEVADDLESAVVASEVQSVAEQELIIAEVAENVEILQVITLLFEVGEEAISELNLACSEE